MTLRRIAALGLGLLSVAPIVYLVVFLTYIMPQFESLFGRSGPPVAQFDALFGTVFYVHLSVIILVLALIGFYVVHVLRARHLSEHAKPAWIAAIVIGNMVVMPIAWYFFIWRQPIASPQPRHTPAA